MPHLTDGTNLASDLNALSSAAEGRLLKVHGSKEKVEAIVNAALRQVDKKLAENIPEVQALVINALVMSLVRSIPGRTAV